MYTVLYLIIGRGFDRPVVLAGARGEPSPWTTDSAKKHVLWYV